MTAFDTLVVSTFDSLRGAKHVTTVLMVGFDLFDLRFPALHLQALWLKNEIPECNLPYPPVTLGIYERTSGKSLTNKVHETEAFLLKCM